MRILSVIITLLFCSILSAQPAPYQAGSITSTLNTNDFVYESSTDRIYAAVSSDDVEFANSFAVINPVTNTVVNTFALDAEATTIAISTDGQYIYLGFRELSVIKRFSIATQSFDAEFPVGFDNWGTNLLYTLDIDVAPGQNDVIAVARCDEDGNAYGAAVYDAGVKLPLSDEDYSNRVKFSNAETLYSLCNGCMPVQVRKFTLNDEGITLVSETEPGITNSDQDREFIYHNEKFYFDNGLILNLLPSPSLSSETLPDGPEGDIVYDNYNDLICLAYRSPMMYTNPETGNWYPDWHVRIDRYNMNNYTLNSSFFIESVWDVDKVITCGDGCYAMRTTFWNNDITYKNLVIARDTPLSADVHALPNRSVSLYPNPSSDYIVINGIDTKSANIYDINGRNIANVQLTENRLDIRNFAQGLYLVKITDQDNNIYTEKVIKR